MPFNILFNYSLIFNKLLNEKIVSKYNNFCYFRYYFNFLLSCVGQM